MVNALPQHHLPLVLALSNFFHSLSKILLIASTSLSLLDFPFFYFCSSAFFRFFSITLLSLVDFSVVFRLLRFPIFIFLSHHFSISLSFPVYRFVFHILRIPFSSVLSSLLCFLSTHKFPPHFRRCSLALLIFLSLLLLQSHSQLLSPIPFFHSFCANCPLPHFIFRSVLFHSHLFLSFIHLHIPVSAFSSSSVPLFPLYRNHTFPLLPLYFSEILSSLSSFVLVLHLSVILIPNFFFLSNLNLSISIFILTSSLYF